MQGEGTHHTTVQRDMMDETRPLLASQPQEGPDVPHMNLRPRHQDLIPTPCGPMKRWSELSGPVKLYFCFTLASLSVLLAVIASSLYKQRDFISEEDFTVSLIQLVGILFCIYYVTRGVLQENRQELIVFVLSVIALVTRSVVNFTVLSAQDKQQLLVRFACTVCLGVTHIVCTSLLIHRSNTMAFRVGGALESLQERYRLLNLCFSMVTFDFQAQLCFCILIVNLGTIMSLTIQILLVCSVLWACLTVAVGVVAVLKESRILVLVFVLQNIPEVGFFIYLMYMIINKWLHDDIYILEAASIVGAVISVGIKAVLLQALWMLLRSTPLDEA